MSKEILERYEKIQKILESSEQSNSKFRAKKVSLVVVSKSKPIEDISVLYHHGQKAFAENYVQEFLDKKDKLSSLDIDWHFIGGIQRNKLKKIVGEAALIHSVDSVKILREMNKVAAEKSVIQDFLFQVYWENSENRKGILPTDLEEAIQESQQLKNVRLKGLMTVPPQIAQGEASREYFSKLRLLKEKFMILAPQMEHLSMGMSSDFQIAMEEGASLIRLGSVILGAR